MKQQGHFYDMNVLAYSTDGQLIATGGDDGKVVLLFNILIISVQNNTLFLLFPISVSITLSLRKIEKGMKINGNWDREFPEINSLRMSKK